MSDSLTLADFAPAIVGLFAMLMGSVAVWHATRGTRRLRRQRREAAARQAEAGGPAPRDGADLAKAAELADRLAGLLHAARRAREPDARAAE
ncbi:MAG TPA: hypothetical protein VGW40_12180 [Allosphingosinicella sp.]|nr:hypothetical protein [Allosphingosinicella sp.]